MIKKFKDEYFWMLREGKGYFPWIKDNAYRLARHLYWERHSRCIECHNRFSPRELVRLLTEENVCESPLFDILLKALIRAEVRLISRFVPQRSHEERLTGNLVSEIDSAIFLVKDAFEEISFELYSEAKHIDFLYYDLSRGGKIEKQTGADLGIILVVDLPDFPFTVKSFVLQAKKITYSSAQIKRKQFETLSSHSETECGYLLYDMELARRCSPLVVPTTAHPLTSAHEESAKKGTDSFSLCFDDARSYGHPLSLFIVSHLPFIEKVGTRYNSFKEAFGYFERLCHHNFKSNKRSAIPDFNGRLAIVSVGRTISFSTPHNEGFLIDL